MTTEEPVSPGREGIGAEAAAASRARKAPDAYRTISEVAEELRIPQHRLRSWETLYSGVKPFRGESGRRYYSPEHVARLRLIADLLYVQGYKGQGVLRVLRDSESPSESRPVGQSGQKHSEQKHSEQGEIAFADPVPGSPETETETESGSGEESEFLREFPRAESAWPEPERSGPQIESVAEWPEPPAETRAGPAPLPVSPPHDEIAALRAENAALYGELEEILGHLLALRKLLPG